MSGETNIESAEGGLGMEAELTVGLVLLALVLWRLVG